MVVHYYEDPQGFSEETVYPCDTQFMVYNDKEHKYYLTDKALAFHGIDVERKWVSSSNNKTLEFIQLVSKKVYDYIRYKSGWANFQVQMYRVATAANGVNLDKYNFRKEFENALISEAKWLIDNGDSARFSATNLLQGKQNGVKPEEHWENCDDIADETKRTLSFLGLDRWFRLSPFAVLDKNKY